MVDGVPTGQGTISAYKDGKKILDYVGGIVDGEASGQGRLTTYDTAGAVAATYSGLWAQGKPAGPGTVVRLPNTPGSSPVPSPQSTYSAMPAGAGQSQPASADNLDPARRSEIGDISNYFHSMKPAFVPMMGVSDGYQRILRDPSASRFETKIAIANGFLYRSQVVGDPDAWEKEPIRLGYMKTARIWYRLAFSQLKREHPEIDPAAYYPSDNRPPVPLTELSRTLALNKGKEVGDSASREFRSFVLNGYQNFKGTPDDRTIESAQASLEQTQTQEAREKSREKASQDAFQKRLPGLLAQRKDVGDTVCDLNGNSGYVEKVHGDKIQVRTRSGVKQGWTIVNQWENLDWVNYNKVYKCND
jgi:hypothetical protein